MGHTACVRELIIWGADIEVTVFRTSEVLLSSGMEDNRCGCAGPGPGRPVCAERGGDLRDGVRGQAGHAAAG